MTALNRTLNVLTLVLAVLTLVFGVLLYERRQQLDTRADMLAKTVADVTQTLDVDSGTRYSDRIHVDSISNPQDPAQTLAGGTLGADHFHLQIKQNHGVAGFQSILDEVSRQAREVQAQRNALSDALEGVAETLAVDVDGEALRIVANAEYANAATQVASGVERVAEREQAMVNAVVEASLALGHPIDERTLADFDDVDAVMRGFAQYARLTQQRGEDYASVLTKLPELVDAYDFQANPNGLQDREDYSAQLNHLLGDFTVINQQLRTLKRAKVELQEQQIALEEYAVALDDSKDAIHTLNVRLANLQGYYDVLRDRLARCQHPPVDERPAMDVRAQVVKVDHEYNYIIIDLGSKDHLTPNTLLNIGRDRGLVCKVSVTRVMDEYAVCEVLPEFRLAAIKKGDRVVLR